MPAVSHFVSMRTWTTTSTITVYHSELYNRRARKSICTTCWLIFTSWTVSISWLQFRANLGG